MLCGKHGCLPYGFTETFEVFVGTAYMPSAVAVKSHQKRGSTGSPYTGKAWRQTRMLATTASLGGKLSRSVATRLMREKCVILCHQRLTVKETFALIRPRLRSATFPQGKAIVRHARMRFLQPDSHSDQPSIVVRFCSQGRHICRPPSP